MAMTTNAAVSAAMPNDLSSYKSLWQHIQYLLSHEASLLRQYERIVRVGEVPVAILYSSKEHQLIGKPEAQGRPWHGYKNREITTSRIRKIVSMTCGY